MAKPAQSSPEVGQALGVTFMSQTQTLVMTGGFELASYPFFSKIVADLFPDLDPSRPLCIDADKLAAMDSSGAWGIVSFKRAWEAKGGTLSLRHFPERFSELIFYLDRVIPDIPEPVVSQPIQCPFLEGLGRVTLTFLLKMRALVAFLGELLICLGAWFKQPKKAFWVALITQMEQTGLAALPVVGLVAFLIGVVLTFQGSDQLSRFGATLYTVNLVSISILREVGILLTAIVVAGRSGSAFTAQIGSMKLNQELDALRTMGFDPVVWLVIPRVLALVLMMPLLAFFADIVGLLGGAIMAHLHLNISFFLFVEQFKQSVTLWTVGVGIIKAPVFAFVIAWVACYEGFSVKDSAESVGQHTTKSVVEGITFVLIADALFSILFTRLGI